ncbi:hypothetical protein GMDG_00978 [Pseudogymnoascus destructans 20631-21]|uniref:Uncharacterized protein n=2 Tax=Pseudogymnoascus destructans TaxID=655981 RepID=L8FML4_PSED2|nr:hypothetical protein GMDG_00978 [Pseudogymnoascus destructans 20631-21]
MATTLQPFKPSNAFTSLIQVFRFNISDVPSVALEWIVAHPGQTAILVIEGVGIFTPAALSGPLLASMGFGATGPVAGSVAASLQSMLGNVGAHRVFAYLQSAAMGGYGVSAINGVTQACAVISGWFVSKL